MKKMLEINKRKITCIVCPLGCKLEVTVENRRVAFITGNQCPKGIDFAKEEIEAPKRTLISVVKVKNGDLPVVSVKTANPIPKESLFEIIKQLAKSELEAPIERGDVILHEVAPIIATRAIRKTM